MFVVSFFLKDVKCMQLVSVFVAIESVTKFASIRSEWPGSDCIPGVCFFVPAGTMAEISPEVLGAEAAMRSDNSVDMIGTTSSIWLSKY